MEIRGIKRILVGNPLSSEMLENERISKKKALAVLSSDALSSVAYATEEILIPLSTFAAASMAWSIPIAFAIAALIFIVTISYRQTIDAYPNGGGAYTVAKENLGVNAGLVAGAALLIDYVLTVSVSVAAGVENIASAFPLLHAHREAVGVIIIIIITVFNLRGVKESANFFALPTYFFIFSFCTLIVVGFWKYFTGDTASYPALRPEVYPEIPIFLLLRAFSSGCSAMTGIEAITNGIPIFKEPAQKNAKTTMIWMAAILTFMFLGNTLLAHVFELHPSETQTTISLLARRVFGDGVMYYVIQASTALILILAANTSFADFPRLSSLLAKDRFLPRQLASLGDRLVFSNGIIWLSTAAILLIIAFEGDTHSLIPLYAVGVFLSFTLSQLGMIIHHLRLRELNWRKSIVFNTLGFLATGIVSLVISYTKFMSGAWIVVLLIPIMVFLFKEIHRHYAYTALKLSKFSTRTSHVLVAKSTIAIIPVSGIHQGVFDSIQYATSISQNVMACVVSIDPGGMKEFRDQWKTVFPQVPLVVLESPYRSIIRPCIDYIDKMKKENPNALVTVIIPEFMTRWYHQFLHNQTAIVLYAYLRAKKGIVVTSIRYHLSN